MKHLIGCLAVVLVGACSSPITQENGSSRLGEMGEETSRRLEEVTEELDGLDPAARRKALIDLALKEGGALTLYGVTDLAEMAEHIDAFEEDTGVTVNNFRAGSEELQQRLLEEADAGFRSADVVNQNGAEITYLAREKLLAPLETPASADLPPDGVKDDWFWSYIDIFAPAWNTDLISSQEAPRTWEEVLTKYGDQLLMEAGDIDWFATLVQDYFVAQKGMTEEEAIELVRQAATEATFVHGHTLMVELLASGEYAVAATPFSHRIEEFKEDGAPIAWEPAVSPLVARPEGVAIHATAEHPAAALLFVEWYLTDGQPLGKTQTRQPASTAVPGGGLPEQYESLVVNLDALIDEFDKWSKLYTEIVQGSEQDVIED